MMLHLCVGSPKEEWRVTCDIIINFSWTIENFDLVSWEAPSIWSGAVGNESNFLHDEIWTIPKVWVWCETNKEFAYVWKKYFVPIISSVPNQFMTNLTNPPQLSSSSFAFCSGFMSFCAIHKNLNSIQWRLFPNKNCTMKTKKNGNQTNES